MINIEKFHRLRVMVIKDYFRNKFGLILMCNKTLKVKNRGYVGEYYLLHNKTVLKVLYIEVIGKTK